MAARVGIWYTWFLFGCYQFKISRLVYVPTCVRRIFVGVNREGICLSGKCRNKQVETYIAVVKHLLSFLAVTCFTRVGGVTTLSACVSSFWIWAGLHSNARGGAERNAHRFPLFLACFACRFWLLPHGIGKGNCYHPVPPPTFLLSPSLSLSPETWQVTS